MKMHNHKWTMSNSLVPLRMALAVLSHVYGSPIGIDDIIGLRIDPHRVRDVDSGLVDIKGLKKQIRLHEPTKVRRVDLQFGLDLEGPIDISHVKTLVLWDHDSQEWVPALLEFGKVAFYFDGDFTPIKWKIGKRFVQFYRFDSDALKEIFDKN